MAESGRGSFTGPGSMSKFWPTKGQPKHNTKRTEGTYMELVLVSVSRESTLLAETQQQVKFWLYSKTGM